ncbi:hypothetical protein ACHQM5_025209 [Ranunculus cassubicifolius]
MASLISLLCISTIIMALFDPILAVLYGVEEQAPWTPGGIRFEKEVGPWCAMEELEKASKFIWNTFKQDETQRKYEYEVVLHVKIMDGISQTKDNMIYLNTGYIENFLGNVKIETVGIIYHETTHVWQWNGNGNAPSGLLNGIADYVRLKANLAPLTWSEKGSGNRWDEGYAVTAYFLDYCNDLKDGFVASLNRMMKHDYNDEFFARLLGKTVDQLWKDYKEKYGTK